MLLFKAMKWEIFLELVSRKGKFLDWYFSHDENHLWIGSFHAIWNPQYPPRKPLGEKEDGLTATGEGANNSA